MLNVTKFLITLCTALLLFSCSLTDTREAPSTQPTVVVESEEATTQQSSKSAQDEVDAKTEQTESKRSTGEVVIGAVLATAVTIWVVTEFIEKKVVPVVLTLVVAGLIYEASRNSDSKATN